MFDSKGNVSSDNKFKLVPDGTDVVQNAGSSWSPPGGLDDDVLHQGFVSVESPAPPAPLPAAPRSVFNPWKPMGRK